MKRFSISLLALAIASTGLFSQTWELLFTNPAILSNTELEAIPGPDNGVRVVNYQGFGSPIHTFYNLDENGNFVNTNTIPSANNWEFLHADETGATYWWAFYKIRKYNANDQPVWTYTTNQQAGAFWLNSAANGHTFFQTFDSGGDTPVEELDENGLLVNSFSDADGELSDYYPGWDGSMTYSILGNNDTILYRKQDKNHQVMWEKWLFWGEQIVQGSTADGATYMTTFSESVQKIGPFGQVEWSRDFTEYWPAPGSWVQFHQLLPLSDGNVVLSFVAYDTGTGLKYPVLVKVDPMDGSAIWTKSYPQTEELYLNNFNRMFEMTDGGILAGYSSSGFHKLLILRTDANGNALTNQIRGKIQRDQNGDCTAQTTEPGMKGISVIAKSGTKSYSATTAADGSFEINCSAGDHQISFGQLGSYWGFCNMANPVSLGTANDTVQLNIVAKALVDCPEMALSIGSPVFRRCFDNNYLNISYQNLGTVVAQNATVTVTLDPKLLFVSATFPPAGQSGQAYTFALGDVGAGGGGSFKIIFKVDCDATLGEMLCVDGHIYPDTSCGPTAASLADGAFCLPVVASFDPNDKTAFVGGRPETAKVQPGQGLEYVIRFQNTGTDTAFNIVILDTLDAKLDGASVVPGASSHPYQFNLVDGRVLRFSFSNILLPDSNTNEAASHGYIKFFVKQAAGNAIGDEIPNRAAIYFDFNDPVITNESKLTVTPIVRTNGVLPPAVAHVWPSPTTGRADIVLENVPFGPVDWSLHDAMGRPARSGRAASSAFFIERDGLPNGFYFLKCRLQNGTTVSTKIIYQ